MPGPPLRIAFVATSFPPDLEGGGRHHAECARRLRARGHVLEVFTWGEMDDEARAADARLPLPVHRAAKRERGSVLDPGDLVAWLAERSPEVVFVSRVAGTTREVVAAAARRAPLVLSPDGLDARGRGIFGRRRERRRRGLQRARGVVVGSEEAGRRAAGLRLRAPITVVHPGIDTVAFTPFAYRRDRARAQLDLGDRRVLVTFADRDGEGAARVIDALPSLRLRFPDLLQLVVGDGDARDSLATRAAERGVADLVRFRDRDGDPRPCYVACDVFVMASEGGGEAEVDLSCVEAGACGAPVVASAAANEAVVDGETGIVVDTADPARLADAIGGLLDDPARARRLAEAARRHCARFDWERSIDALERALRAAAHGRSP